MCNHLFFSDEFYLSQATVLLAVNISYLAIPNINITDSSASVGQVASLLSTIASTGCIVVGLLLVSEDHTDPKGGPFEVCDLKFAGKVLLLYSCDSS